MKIQSAIVIFVIAFLLVAGCVASSPSSPVSTSTTTASPTPVTSTPISTVTVANSPTQSSTLSPSSGTMTVNFIDVGQGDSELIQTPSGKTMLIDAGPTDSSQTVAQYLRDQGISTIDIVVATHPHEDHIGGMSTVLNGFTVKQFIDSGYPYTTSTYEDMLNLIDKKNIPFQTVTSGDTISLDPALTINVLNPLTTFSSDVNQNSIVLKITYGKVTYLFTGDAGSDAESNFMNTAGHADILKVAHHGSSTSSSSTFLSHITPAVSVIEVGAGNPYGHPAASTLKRLEQIGSKVYRTDLSGTIKITSDGNTYSVSTAKTTVGASTAASTTHYQITTQPVSGSAGTVVCDCSYNRYNCADFPTRVSAQACYDYCEAQGKGDVHKLDGDNNGKVCESKS
jgi:competence protein ComEC